nr:hypothetical protein [Tanacetum cinerariifolium]
MKKASWNILRPPGRCAPRWARKMCACSCWVASTRRAAWACRAPPSSSGSPKAKSSTWAPPTTWPSTCTAPTAWCCPATAKAR